MTVRMHWTQADEYEAIRLKANALSCDDIGGILDRGSGSNVWKKLNSIGVRTVADAKALVKELGITPPAPREAVAPPPHNAAVAARERLAEARGRQSRLSALMGDPPPGFSALDRARETERV